jgi:hypothetical protein
LTLISLKKPHSSLTRGAQGEHFFEGHFLDKGAFIASPKHDLHRIDFIVEWGGSLVRVNVKTMVASRGHFVSDLRTNGAGKKRKYRPGEIDYFGIVSLEYKRIWMLPMDDVHTGHLHWYPPGKRLRKQHNSFNWDQYLITETASSLQLDIDSYRMNRVSNTDLVKLS